MKTTFSEKFLFRSENQKIEEAEGVRERLEELGVKAEGLEKFHSRFLKKMPQHIEKMYEEYPEIAGYITMVKASNLPGDALVRTGSYLNEKGNKQEQ